MSAPPSWQFACAAYTPLLTANLSVIGSALILWSVVAGGPTNRRPHHRILGAMSMYDLIYSVAKAWTFLLAPRGYGVPGAQGNMRTCALQGFCIELAHATGAYNAALSVYNWLVICRGVKTETFERRIEPVLHVAISTIFWGFAIAGVVIDLFNPAFGFCFIASYPPGCGTTGGPKCERWEPEIMGLMYEIFAQLWVQIYFVIVIFTNAAIWWKVRQQEILMRRYEMTLVGHISSSKRTELCRRRAKSRRQRLVAVQSALYVGAFAASWTGPTIFHLAGWIGGHQSFGAVMTIVIFTPLQGFWNAFIYCRPTYLRLRRKNRTWTRSQCVRAALFGTPGCGGGRTTSTTAPSTVQDPAEDSSPSSERVQPTLYVIEETFSAERSRCDDAEERAPDREAEEKEKEGGGKRDSLRKTLTQIGISVANLRRIEELDEMSDIPNDEDYDWSDDEECGGEQDGKT